VSGGGRNLLERIAEALETLITMRARKELRG
jgi:hypothetical protein